MTLNSSLGLSVNRNERGLKSKYKWTLVAARSELEVSGGGGGVLYVIVNKLNKKF